MSSCEPREDSKTRLLFALFFLFFAASGYASLVYELVWLRLAMAEFGVTTPLVSIVLAVFMSGLGLGAYWGGLVARRFRGAPSRALLLYAACEFAIGVGSVVVPLELDWGRELLARSRNTAWGSFEYHAASGVFVTLALLPWCTLMGATLPVAMAALRVSASVEKETFSRLYLANVTGAILGIVAFACVLVEMLGFHGTLLATAPANFMVAATALLVGMRMRTTDRPLPDARPAPALVRPAGSRGNLVVLFLTGLASLAMEVVWIRLYGPYLGNVVYAFAEILAVYLVGTTVGAALYRRSISSGRFPRPERAWLLLGPLALLPLALTDPRIETIGLIEGLVRVALGIGPFACVLGYVTPQLVDRRSSGDPSLAGSAYAVNVLGSILGPLVAGFGLLPFLPEPWALVVLSLPLFGLGLAAVRVAGSGGRAWTARAQFGALLLVAALLVRFSESFEELYPERQVRRDATATVMAAGEGKYRQLRVNGTNMTFLSPLTKMMVHLPLAFLDRPPSNALIIAFGMGTTFRSGLSWGIPTTVVDLVPGVVELFGYFHADASDLLASPNARIEIDDGRRFLERTRERFDTITIDPPPPVTAAGTSLLYSVEFYSVAKKQLARGGILQQWLPEGDPPTASSVTQALLGSFRHVRVFRSIEGWGFHYLASDEPLPARSAEELASRLPPAAVRDLLEWGPHRDSAALQFEAVLSKELSPQELVDADPDAPALSDHRPINEYYFLRHMRRGREWNVIN